MAGLLYLDREVALCFPQAVSVLLHLDFLLTHVALHAHDLLLHAPVVLVYLLHPVSLNPYLFDLLSGLLISLFEALALLHGLMQISE